jgi:nucleoside-diphosphate-sugar epimerase
MQESKIFVTGATGFVGTNLIKYLTENNFTVKGVSRVQNNELIGYDSFFEALKVGKNTIVHLAGKAHDLKNVSDSKSYFDVNYEKTKIIYDAFLNSNSEIFIYMSSVKAVKDTVTGILTEEDNPEPVTAYGQSKLMAESYIMSNLPKNKRVYILRPCMIHGAGNKGNLNLLYKFVKKGIPWFLGAFDNKRSFLSIDNLCFVIKKIIEKQNIASGIYNVADDTPLSTNELIVLMGESLQKTPIILKTPKLLIYTLAKIGDVLRLPINSEKLQKLTENYIVDNQKINKEIGEPLPLNSSEGMTLTFQSFRTNKF